MSVPSPGDRPRAPDLTMGTMNALPACAALSRRLFLFPRFCSCSPSPWDTGHSQPRKRLRLSGPGAHPEEGLCAHLCSGTCGTAPGTAPPVAPAQGPTPGTPRWHRELETSGHTPALPAGITDCDTDLPSMDTTMAQDRLRTTCRALKLLGCGRAGIQHGQDMAQT